MANEIRAHLSATYAGMTITARLVTPAGVQQGSPITLAESSSVPALFIASVPPGTPAGRYDVRVEDAAGVIGVDELEWDGQAQVRTIERVTDLWVMEGHDGNDVEATDPDETTGLGGSMTAGDGAQVWELTRTANGHRKRRTT